MSWWPWQLLASTPQKKRMEASTPSCIRAHAPAPHAPSTNKYEQFFLVRCSGNNSMIKERHKLSMVFHDTNAWNLFDHTNAWKPMALHCTDCIFGRFHMDCLPWAMGHWLSMSQSLFLFPSLSCGEIMNCSILKTGFLKRKLRQLTLCGRAPVICRTPT